MEKNEIIVMYGSDAKEMAKEILRAANIELLIGGRDKKIGLKPNLVVAKPASGGATTHPEILAGTIEYLQNRGFTSIAIIEGSWVGDRTKQAFKICGYDKLAEKYGVELIDTQQDGWHTYDCAGMKMDLCDSGMAVDFMINIPVIKGHCQTGMTCALKNCKGLITNAEKRRFHTQGLHRPIAHLNTVAKTDFILVDGICGDLDFEEGGNPVPMNRMLGVRDRVLCDAYVAELMGFEVDEVPYIRMAEKLGVGSADTSQAKVTELNRPVNDTGTVSGRKVKQLERYAAPKDACSACYGSLIHALGRMSESGELDTLEHKVCIGQGYKDKTGELGVGSCTRNFTRSLPGCPPRAKDIIEFLRR